MDSQCLNPKFPIPSTWNDITSKKKTHTHKADRHANKTTVKILHLTFLVNNIIHTGRHKTLFDPVKHSRIFSFTSKGMDPAQSGLCRI